MNFLLTAGQIFMLLAVLALVMPVAMLYVWIQEIINYLKGRVT